MTFTLQADQGFVFDSNATNHILYSNLLSLLHVVFPSIYIHYVCVSVSLISALLCLFYFQKLLKIFDISDKTIITSTLILGFSFTFWRVSIITEVYAFYLLFVVLFLVNLFKFVKNKKIKNFYYLSFFLGILFLIHIQTLLFGPLYIYFIIKQYRYLGKNVWLGMLITLLLASILLIPVYLGHHPLITVFIMSGSEDSVFSIDFSIVAKSIVRNSGFLIYNFIFFLAFLFYGIKNQSNRPYIVISLFPFLLFCIKHDVTDSYVFHLVPYLFLVILIARGLDKFPQIPLFTPILLPLFYFATYKLIVKTSLGEKIQKEKEFKGGVRYMFFPVINGNPDLNYFLEKYNKDSLYKKQELKNVYPFVIQWEMVKKKYN